MQGFKLMYCFLRVLRGCVCRVVLRVLRGCVCRWLYANKLPQMVVQNIEQTNFLRVLLGCGCRVSS